MVMPTSEHQMGINFSSFMSAIFLSESVCFGNWGEKQKIFVLFVKSGLIVALIFAPTASVATSEGVCWQFHSIKHQNMSTSHTDSGWLHFFSFFLLLGHSTSLLGLQTGGAAQLLQTGRFTGKVTQAESPSFPPRALLEVSWVCQMS